MKSILKLALGLVLIVVALAIFLVTTVVAFFWKVIVSVNSEQRQIKDILTATGSYFVGIAAAFDQLGNFSFGGFFNWMFIEDLHIPHVKFGDKDDTISEVLGWNEALNNQTDTAKKLVALLDYIDPNHCRLAMKSGVDKTEQKHHKYQKLWRAL